MENYNYTIFVDNNVEEDVMVADVFIPRTVGVLRTALDFVGGIVGSVAVNMPPSKLLSFVNKDLGSCTSLGGIISLAWDCGDKQGNNGWIAI